MMQVMMYAYPVYIANGDMTADIESMMRWASLLLTLPVVHPVMMAAGFDPIWFGVVLVILLEIGLITPPVGVNLFVIQGMADTTLGEVSWGSLPYVLLLLGGVLVLTLVPDIALWLPRKLF